jgi:hypothetical protein
VRYGATPRDLVCGVSPLQDESEHTHSHIDTARDWLFARAFAQPADRVVLVSAATAAPETADALQVKVLRA